MTGCAEILMGGCEELAGSRFEASFFGNLLGKELPFPSLSASMMAMKTPPIRGIVGSAIGEGGWWENYL